MIVGDSDNNFFIEPPTPPQGGIKVIRVAGGGNHKYVGGKHIQAPHHLADNSPLHFFGGSITRSRYHINLVDEEDCRCELCGGLEQLPDVTFRFPTQTTNHFSCMFHEDLQAIRFMKVTAYGLTQERLT